MIEASPQPKPSGPDPGGALGEPVPVASISAALKSLWAANAAHTRCSLINLVVYSEQPGSLAGNAALLGAITADHACRAIIIEAHRSRAPEAPPVSAWITAHCHLDPAGGRSMCSEQIAFRLQGSPARLVPNTVFAHLDSDLPLALWWQGGFSDAFESHLTSRIDRLVIDSACWTDPKREFLALQQARKQSSARFVIMDLVSTRLFAHRLALAACFDTPEALAGLDRIREITIRHAPDQRFTALTFAAWVALRAGWDIGCNGGIDPAITTPDGAQVTLHMTADADTDKRCCAGVGDVVLSGDAIRVSLAIDASGRYVQSRAAVADHAPISCLTPVAAHGTAALVSNRLRQPANDALYFQIWNKLLACL